MSQIGTTPPRVLFLFTQLFANGGIQRFNQTIIDACVQLGIQCEVLSLNDAQHSQRNRPAHANLTVVCFSGNRRRFALAAAAALLRGRHDRILIGHINFLVLAIGILALRPLHRARTLLIAHGIEVWSGIHWVRRAALARIEQILCVSRYTRARILAQAPALVPERLLIFPNALADSWARTAPQLSERDPRARFILSVTRLERGDRYKGIASVIEGFSMLADTSMQYFIVGWGDDLPFLQRVAERNGVSDRVHFLREVGDAELVSFYKNCQAFVLPSGKEGFGIVFLEAMFFGAPVIAAREKGAIDVVQDGESGLLVPFGDTIAIKEAIECVLADKLIRERLRANGHALVVDDGPFTFRQFSLRCSEVFAFGVIPRPEGSVA